MQQAFGIQDMRPEYVMRYYQLFPVVIPHTEADCSRVTHPSATDQGTEVPLTVRLECVMHAASVNPEPGSNSLKNVYLSG